MEHSAKTAAIKRSLLWFVPLVLVAIGLTWKLVAGVENPLAGGANKEAGGLTIRSVASICTPQPLAKFPPDPGIAGRLTPGGIDADSDGVRDDVQRYIAMNWGCSERAVRALSLVAKGAQMEVLIGNSISRGEALALAEKFVAKALACYSRSVDKAIIDSGALDRVVKTVADTPERSRQKDKFDGLLANHVFLLTEAPTPDLCGYDPATLPN
jgi:hypothetical protein